MLIKELHHNDIMDIIEEHLRQNGLNIKNTYGDWDHISLGPIKFEVEVIKNNPDLPPIVFPPGVRSAERLPSTILNTAGKDVGDSGTYVSRGDSGLKSNFSEEDEKVGLTD